MIRTLTHNRLSWIDIEHPQKSEIDSLAQTYSLHPLNVEDCLSKRQLSKLDDHDEQIFVLFHFPLHASAESSYAVISSQVSFFLGSDFIISVHEPEPSSIGKLFLACSEDPKRKSSVMKSSARLLYQIMDLLVDDLFPILQKVEENLEDISDKVFDERRSVALHLSSLRRAIGDLRRIISPLRRLVGESALKSERFAKGEDLSEYFDDVRDHVEKAWEMLEGAKETIEIYKDTDNILSIETTNKVLLILTIVSVLTIPATVVGTIYGMNVPMPGALVPGAATFLGTYTTFWFAVAASIIPAAELLLYFRRRGWL